MTESATKPVPEFALETRNLTRKFGAYVAVDSVNLGIRPGARHALIGPNGAGKTTLINLLSGRLKPGDGEVFLGGHDVTGLAQHVRVKHGLSRTFQINTLFPDMTVLEAVTLAVLETRGKTTHWWQPVGTYEEEIEEADAILTRLQLSESATTPIKNLAYGRGRLVEIALALAARPRVLLLDEPAAGVATRESDALFETIAALPREVTLLLIEHDMDLVFRFAERITVMVAGAILVEDTPDAIARDARVREVYFGARRVG
jgi:ABC-type branched-subunit amino acid transport system ATPase component